MKKMRSSLASSCARAMSLPCCLQSVADEDCYSDCYSDCLPVITQFIVSLLHLSLASTRIDVSSLLSVYAISDLPLPHLHLTLHFQRYPLAAHTRQMASPRQAPDVLVRVTDAALDWNDTLGSLQRFVMSESTTDEEPAVPASSTMHHASSPKASNGASACFVGSTRGSFKGKRVVHLSYECYAPMAERVMRKVCMEAIDTFGISRVAVVHRIGVVLPGEASIAVFTSSPHRAEALRAVRYVVDNVKARAPFWKKEVYDDGSVWKENAEWNPDGAPVLLSNGDSDDDASWHKGGKTSFLSSFMCGLFAGGFCVIALHFLFLGRRVSVSSSAHHRL